MLARFYSLGDETMSREEQKQFIVEYLEKQSPFGISAVDEKFHESFSEKFGGKIAAKYWGAQPNYKAMRLLAELVKKGVLSRYIVNIAEAQHKGFPSWVYEYVLSEK